MGNEERKAVKETAGRNTHTRPDRRECTHPAAAVWPSNAAGEGVPAVQIPPGKPGPKALHADEARRENGDSRGANQSPSFFG